MKRKKTKIAFLLKLVFAIPILSLFFACRSNKLPQCITKMTKEIEISWGRIYSNSKDTIRFSLKTDANIIQTKPQKRHIVRLDDKTFCNFLLLINETFLKTQVINEIGDTLDFMEYKNPTNGFYSRAIWNPRFKTKNSFHFRKLFDSINVYVNNRK